MSLFLRNLRLLTILLLAAVACNLPFSTSSSVLDEGRVEPVEENTEEPETIIDEAPLQLEVPRIDVRVVEGIGEFYNTATNETFVPRGVNYVDFVQNSRGGFHDGVFATNTYDPKRVRTAFQHLADSGYNTVRIFFDTCGFGPECIGNNGNGLNPEYLDNMVDLMHIAGEEGIYLMLTANSMPEDAGYWEYFNDQINEENVLYGFDSYENSDWLHPAGMEIRRRYWQDLMQGMTERNAPPEVVLGWQITNEAWLFGAMPPLSLDEGLVETANGQSYDMADPEQKRLMVTDGWLHVMDEIIPIIKAYDPEALTTMGFFAPQFPNETYIGGDWWVDTAPMVSIAPVDFWDFHAYFDTDLSVEGQAENFGMIADQAKPVIMGEAASGQDIHSSAITSYTYAVDWYDRSCDVGFDGWLHWGYYPWPKEVGGKPWTLLDADGFLFEQLSPAVLPDPCNPPELTVQNVAFEKPVRFSAQLPDEPASAAVDSSATPWVAGDLPPQWIEIDLQEPTTIQRVGLSPEQWPPGEARHQIIAKLADGRSIVIGEHNKYTAAGQQLGFDLPTPLNNVVAVRINLLEGPAWAALKEVEVISSPVTEQTACLLTTNGADLLRYPRLDADKVGSLNVGQIAYADAQHISADGSTWWRIPGEAWLAGERVSTIEGCEAIDILETAEELQLVPITFRVIVPGSGIEEVYLAGDFGREDIPVWEPWSVLLKLEGGNTWTVTLDLPIGADIEYVYTRNSFERIERPESCGETNPRPFTVGAEAMTIEDEVIKWQDLDCE